MPFKSIVIMFLLALLLLSACAPGTGRFQPERKAGFFAGIWHGWIAPVTLIWQIFDPDVRIYETQNTGWGYDLGFYLAVVGGFGSIAFSRKRRKRD